MVGKLVFISVIGVVLLALFAFLPVTNFDPVIVLDYAEWLGGILASFDFILPIGAMLTLFATIIYVEISIFTFKLVKFIIALIGSA